MTSETLPGSLADYDNPIINNRFLRTSSEREWRAAVADEFIAVGMDDEAEKWSNCSDTQRLYWSQKLPRLEAVPAAAKALYVCSHDPSHQVECRFASCDNRLCPDCARRHSARMLARYVPVMLKSLHEGKARYSLRHVMLSTDVHISDPDLAAKIKLFAGKVQNVFDTVLPEGWKKSQGMLFGFEFGEDGQYLHFHCLHYGQFMAQPEISDAWKAETGCSVVWVRNVARKHDAKDEVEGAVAEIVKYTTKFFKVDEETGEKQYIEPSLIPHVYKSLKGQRRFRSYGIFYNVPEPEREPCTCKVCNAVMARWKRIDYEIYLNTGFMPVEWDMVFDEPLNLTLANKSPPESGDKSGKSPPSHPGPENIPMFDVSILHFV